MHEGVFIPAIAFMNSINGEMRQQLETYRTRVQEKDLVDIENVFFTEWKKQESNLQAFSLPSEAMEHSFAQYLDSTYPNALRAESATVPRLEGTVADIIYSSFKKP